MFHGHVAAATSTGGLTNKMAGRVGTCSAVRYSDGESPVWQHFTPIPSCPPRHSLLHPSHFILPGDLFYLFLSSSLPSSLSSRYDAGDTSIIGAGTYANDRTCAVSATGKGEEFMRAVAAYDVAGKPRPSVPVPVLCCTVPLSALLCCLKHSPYISYKQ